MAKFALDTNILIHLHSGDDHKKEVGRDLLTRSPAISSQVVTEYFNVMQRVFKKEKYTLMQIATQLFRGCIIKPVVFSTIDIAAQLIRRYDFQLFDGLIVATALEAGCDVLYSTDMQDGLIVEKFLTIKNPY